VSDAATSEMNAELASVVASIPEPIASRIEDAVTALTRTVRARNAPPPGVGDRAPEFELPDPFGRSVRLTERLRSGPVVLAFYRGDWCPFCNIELRALEAALPALRERNASLIAISPQEPERSRALAEKERLTFDVLSDVDQKVIVTYGLQCQVTGDARALYDDVLQFDLSEHNADRTWTLPIPATYVIAPSGVIVAARVDPDYRTRMAIPEILAAIDRSPNASPKEST
jgi:peroxiredoxin